MKRFFCLYLFLLLIMLSCAPAQTGDTDVYPLQTIAKFKGANATGDAIYLGADGKLWMRGQLVRDNFEIGTKDGLYAPTDRQLSLLPAAISAHLNEKQTIVGLYNYQLIAEDIADFFYDRNLYYLKRNGELYSWRGAGVNIAPQPYDENKDNGVLLCREVTKLLHSNNVLNFITTKNELVSVLDYNLLGYNRKGSSPYESVEGVVLTKLADNMKFSSNDSVRLDTKGNLWVGGFNDFGILANGKIDPVSYNDYLKLQLKGIKVTTDGYDYQSHYKVMKDVREAYSLGRNVFAIKEDGSLWAWGANEYGTVGNGVSGDGYADTREAVTKPVKILDNVIKIDEVYGAQDLELGKTTIIALTENGDLYLWGCTENGLIGNGVVYDGLSNANFAQASPYLVMQNVVDFSYNWNDNIYALKNNGELYAWGISNTGTVGNGLRAEGYVSNNEKIYDYIVSQPVKVLENVVLLGNCSTMPGAVTSDGTVWGWGSNPFGLFVSTAGAPEESYDSTVGAGLLVLPTPTKNPYISAVIAADGTVSFVPTPTE